MKFRSPASGFHSSPGCSADDALLHREHLDVRRYTSRRCPDVEALGHGLDDLWRGRIGLIELENRFNLVLSQAADGVPSWPGFRRVPPDSHWRVPANSIYPTSPACPKTPSSKNLATSSIAPDTPVPRCLTLRPSQGLRIVNATGTYGFKPRTITVHFIGFSQRVKPGQAAVFRRPVGTYLLPGSHLVTSSYHGDGPEVMVARGGR